MSALGVTHLIVSENWSTAGTNVHDAFLNIIKSYDMKLIITYALPMRDDGESITPDKAKFDFESLMKVKSVWKLKSSKTMYISKFIPYAFTNLIVHNGIILHGTLHYVSGGVPSLT